MSEHSEKLHLFQLGNEVWTCHNCGKLFQEFGQQKIMITREGKEIGIFPGYRTEEKVSKPILVGAH